MDVFYLILYASAAVLALWSLASLVARRKQKLRYPHESMPPRAKPGKSARLRKVPERYSFDI